PALHDAGDRLCRADCPHDARQPSRSARLLFRHALRNAAVPIVTIIGTGFALLISGVVVTDSVFNIPGIGRLTVDAILARDYPIIQAMILLTSAIYVLVNLLIDISYTFFDPRIRYRWPANRNRTRPCRSCSA